MNIGIWQGDRNRCLKRLGEATINLEKDLENWIANDPSLVQQGLKVIGNQVQLACGRVDLLCLDPQGRWIVLEVKRGMVSRDTIAQVIDYGACMDLLSADDLRAILKPHLDERKLDLDMLLDERGGQDRLEQTQRETLLFVVGTGRAPDLQRVVQFLRGKFELPISVILFNVFSTTSSDFLLVRETAETELVQGMTAPKVTVDTVLQLADTQGTGEIMRRAVDVAQKKGLHVRPNRTSLMFTPPTNGTRTLFTLWIKPERNGITAYVGIEPFTEFFPIGREIVEQHLGPEGWRVFTPDELDKFLIELSGLHLGAESTDSQGDHEIGS